MINIENYKKQFQELTIRMISDKEYYMYGYMVSLFDKDFSSKVSTAAIGLSENKRNFTLYLSEWFYNLPYRQKLGILKHECLHFVMKHHIRLIEESKKFKDKVNVAMDIAINQFIKKEDLPTNGQYVEDYGFPKKLSAEEYYKLLPDDVVYNNMDNHEKFNLFENDSNEVDNIADNEISIELTDSLINDILENVEEKIGNMPFEISQIIELSKSKKKINFEKLLSNYLSIKSSKKTTTRKKRNRRFPQRLEIKGKKNKYMSTVAVIIDVSGSMSSTEIAKGLEKINEICKLRNSSLDIVQVDAIAREPEKYSPNIRFIRKGAGGTILYKGIDKLIESKIKYNVLIVISDGYISHSDISNFLQLKKRQIWITKKYNFKNCKHIVECQL